MHHKVFDKVTTTTKKKKKNDKNERKKQEIGNNFFDWLFILHPSCRICIYHTRKKKKKDRPQNWLRDDWLEKCFGWRSERNRCGEAFLTPSVTFGHVCLEGKEKKKKQAKCFYCYSMFNILSTTNIYKKEHYKKKKKWTFILKTESERTSNNEFCLAGNSCPCPFPPPLPPTSSLPFLYSPYLWFLIVA